MSENVIIHHGVMYQKVCGLPVANVGAHTSTCLKRTDHPGYIHEDYEGNKRHEIFGPNVEVLEIPMPKHMTDHTVVTRDMLRAAWEAFVEPTQIAQDDQSQEMLTLAAILRAVNEGLPIPAADTVVDNDQVKEISASPPDDVDAVVVDEVEGPCFTCEKNEWTASNDGAQAILTCNGCGAIRIDK